jgi:hypothetical protein
VTRRRHVRATLVGGLIRGGALAVTAIGCGGVLLTLAMEAIAP